MLSERTTTRTDAVVQEIMTTPLTPEELSKIEARAEEAIAEAKATGAIK